LSKGGNFGRALSELRKWGRVGLLGLLIFFFFAIIVIIAHALHPHGFFVENHVIIILRVLIIIRVLLFLRIFIFFRVVIDGFRVVFIKILFNLWVV
jgi:hypothetical protein